MDEECIKVLEFEIKDLRFPTSLASDGSDAMVFTYNNIL